MRVILDSSKYVFPESTVFLKKSHMSGMCKAMNTKAISGVKEFSPVTSISNAFESKVGDYVFNACVCEHEYEKNNLTYDIGYAGKGVNGDDLPLFKISSVTIPRFMSENPKTKHLAWEAVAQPLSYMYNLYFLYQDYSLPDNVSESDGHMHINQYKNYFGYDYISHLNIDDINKHLEKKFKNYELKTRSQWNLEEHSAFVDVAYFIKNKEILKISVPGVQIEIIKSIEAVTQHFSSIIKTAISVMDI